MAYRDTIPLERINLGDRRFSFSFPEEAHRLVPSVKAVGIVEPLLLLDGPEFTIISGFRRAEAARLVGLAAVPAVVESGLGEKDALLRAIHGNAGRGLNVVEKATALSKMAGLGFSEYEMFAVMTLLDCGPHQKVLQTFLTVAGAEEAFKDFIVSKGLSLKNIEDFLRFDAEERGQLVALFSTFHTTEGYIRDVLRLVSLMKVKEGRIDFTALSGAEDAGSVRARLKRRTYPKLTALEEELERVKGAMALPPNVDIRVDPFFEKEYIDIGVRARDIQDLERALEKLRTTLDDGSMEHILELTKG